MTDVEKLRLIRKIAQTGFELCSDAEQCSFFYGILCAIDDVIGYDCPDKKRNPVSGNSREVNPQEDLQGYYSLIRRICQWYVIGAARK